MKKIQTFMVILGTLLASLSASELEINGDFKNPDAGGIPAGWSMHDWKGFYPLPKIEYQPGKENRIRFYDITGKEGTVFRTNGKIPGRSGDTVAFSATVEGQGGIYVELYTYDERGSWNGGGRKYLFNLKGKPRICTANLPVVNGFKRETGKFLIAIGAFPGADFTLSSVRATLIPGKYRGEAAFPDAGVIFAPVPDGFQPTPNDLRRLPAQLDGVSGRPVVRKDGMIDFAPFFGAAGKRACGWFFTEITVPYDCDYSIGAGADWWMKLYLNGESVVDTLEHGNVKSPCGIGNYTPVVRLKKGKNVLAVKFIRGNSSARLYLGGPAELRKSFRDLTLEKVLEKDDYESLTRIRPGNPLLIQGMPAPGLLTVTRHGVYTTSGRIDFPLELRRFKLDQLGSDQFFTVGLRIQSFGRNGRNASELEYVLINGKERMTVAVKHLPGKQLLELLKRTSEGTSRIGEFSHDMLPADISLSVDRNGAAVVNVSSLSTGSIMNFPLDTGRLFRSGTVDFTFAFASLDGGKAELVADERFCAISSEKKKSAPPHKLNVPDTFDPVKAGWALVFSDEFDGKALDMNKWFIRKPPAERIRLDGKGRLVITVDWDAKQKKLQTPGVSTRESFGYGYFEARLRFTKQPGWWAAFWLYGSSWTNPFVDSTEIDIFEDYYLRPKQKGMPFRKILDHNLHSPFGNVTKSWNFNSTLPGKIDDFYTIGCRWTPFEISFYLDGKLIRAEGNDGALGAFDSFSHNAATAKLQAVLSAQLMGPRWAVQAQDGVFPEEYLIDFVRIYAMPTDDQPQITWKRGQEYTRVKEGDNLVFEADVRPSSKSKSPVKTVYLFDSGTLTAYRTKPPYRFEVPFTQAFYDTTDFSKPGRQNRKSSLRDFHHAFVMFAQDEAGNVAVSDPLVLKLAPDAVSQPYQGTPQKLPGVLRLERYDEGGQNVGYFDTDSVNRFRNNFRAEGVDSDGHSIGHITWGEWLNYTVDVETTGTYRAILRYGQPFPNPEGVKIDVDGKNAGHFRLNEINSSGSWQTNSLAEIDIPLTAGRHLLTLHMGGACNLVNIRFEKKSKP